MAHMFWEDPYHGRCEIIFKKGNYPQGNMGIIMEFLKDGYCVDSLVITVNIPEMTIILGEDETFIDTNNVPDAMDIIKKYRLGTAVKNKKGYSGFCTYPVVKWDMSKVILY